MRIKAEQRQALKEKLRKKRVSLSQQLKRKVRVKPTKVKVVFKSHAKT